MSINLKDVAKLFLEECAEDYVGLWSLVRSVRESHALLSNSQIEHETLRLLLEQLQANRIVAGIFENDETFRIWEETPDEIVRRIGEEWDALGRELDIGDIVWFTLKSSD